MGSPSQSANNQMYTYSYRYIQQFHTVSITAAVGLVPLTVFKNMTMPCQTTQQNFTFLGLVAAILNWGHTHHSRLYMNPIQVYTVYSIPYKYTVTPQPEGPKNTLTNCICTSCFCIIDCLNIVTNLFYASYDT